MQVRVYIALCFLGVMNSLFAQKKLSFRYINEKSYQLFIERKYDSLEVLGKRAIEQGDDFYYLRMRMAISYYERQNYEEAYPHFVAAQTSNPESELIKEYMYYSLIFAGKDLEAREYAQTFPPKLIKRLHVKEPKIDYLNIDIGGSFSSNVPSSQNIKGTANIYGEAVYTEGIKYAGVSSRHTLSNKLQLSWNVSMFSVSALNKIQFGIAEHNATFTNKQSQYNLALKRRLGKGYSASLAAGVFNVEAKYISTKYTNGLYSFDTISSLGSNYLLAAAIARRSKFLETTLSMSKSNLNKVSQFQTQLSCTYYPRGNTRHYSITSLAYKRNDKESSVIFSQTLGRRLTKALNLESYISIGNHANYISSLGFNAFNTSDPIQLMAGIQSKLHIGRLDILTGYAYQQRQATYWNYQTDGIKANKYNYSIHLLTTTLLWNF